MVLQSVSYMFVTFLQAWNFEQSTEGLQPAAGPYHPGCAKPAGWEPGRARVRHIAPPGRDYVIIMTRVNGSIIKKPCLLLPSGRKWISVSASQQDSPQNCYFQLFAMKQPSTSCLLCSLKNVSSLFEIDSPDDLSCTFTFGLGCGNVGNNVSQAEPRPRTETTAILSPLNV